MNRRRFLKLVPALGVGTLTSTSGCVSGGGNSTGTLSQEFGPFSGPFEKVQWSLQGDLFVTISADHQMDGLGIKHEKIDVDDYDGYTCFKGVPLAGGEIGIAFKEKLKETYPSRSFTLVAMEGDIAQSVPYIEGTNSTQGFSVPKNAVGDDYFA